MPPSTEKRLPTTKDAASEQSHTTAAATSSGSPRRPIGSDAMANASVSGRAAKTASMNGVRIAPGQTAWTRMPD
jgi:hypothetical protein